MRYAIFRIVCLGLATLLVCWIAAVSVHRAAPAKATISGEIEAAAQDDGGIVTAVAVYDGEWGLVLIASTGKGKELLKHVGEYAEIQGTLEEQADDAEHDYVMTVSAYVLEDLDYSEEDLDSSGEDTDGQE